VQDKASGSNDNEPGAYLNLGGSGDYTASLEGEIAAVKGSEFIVGRTPITKIPSKPGWPTWVRFRHDGRLFNRTFQSTSYWRMKVRRALSQGEQFELLEIDEWGRLGELFPKSVTSRLAWNAQQKCDPLPVARLFNPATDKEMLLFRSRLRGHAVDALHNFTEGRCIFQPVWIADIMRLNPLLGIKLIRDMHFEPTMRLSEHAPAALG
jgi:hypothetical protein